MPCRVVVVSPHLDDAALSVGGTMFEWTGAGLGVHIVTVFAGDPDNTDPPSWWDAPRDLPSHADVTQCRRDEDRAAAAVLGATTAWLPFADNGYLVRRDPDEIRTWLEPELQSADLVLLPGWPLSHPDHLYAAQLALRAVDEVMPVAFYAEQPYASEPINLAKSRLRGRHVPQIRHALGADIDWRRNRLSEAAQRAKDQSVASYVGELAAIAKRNRWGPAWRHGEWIGVTGRQLLPAEINASLRLHR